MIWKADPDVDILVAIAAFGPLDPFGGAIFDVTEYVRGGGITIRRGRSSEFDSFQPGTCEFELNNDDRRFDPDNASSPFASLLIPNRVMQVVATYAGVSYTLFAGFVGGWPQRQDRADKRPTVPIVAHDFLSVLSRTRLSSVAFVLDQSQLDIDNLSGDLPQQFTGERVRAIIGLAGYSTALPTAIDDGKTLMPETGGSNDLLSAARAAEMAEAGFLYVAGDGTVTFLDRHSRFEDSRLSTVQATFTDNEYGNIDVDHDLTRTWNDVRFSKPGGLPQTSRDQASVDDYGQLTYPESGDSEQIEVLSDGEALGRSGFWIDRYSQPAARPSPITVKPRRNMPSLFARCAGRELVDLIEVERTPQGVGTTTTFTGLVDSVTHRITNQDWETTLAISPFDVQGNTGFLVLDDVVDGELDTAVLAY